MKILELINNFFKSKRRVRFKYVGGAFMTKPRKVNKEEQNQKWIHECIKYHKKVLDGKFKHYCYDWDGLPIDETCKEFECCNCYPNQGKELERSVASKAKSR